MLFRWDAPLFFANAEVFADRVRQAIASSPTPVRWAVVAAEGVDLRFAEMKGPVKDRLKRYALFDRFGDDHFYPTIGAAVSAYLDTTGSMTTGGSLSTHAPRVQVIASPRPSLRLRPMA